MFHRRLAFAVLISALLVALPALAQQKFYVTDTLTVTVRSGPTVENKILSVVKSGDQVKLLESNESGWVKVLTPKGTEGWMLKRYLQDDPTAKIRLEAIDPENQNLAEKIETLTKANGDLEQELESARQKGAQAQENLEKLKQEAQGFIDLRNKHEELKKKFEEQTVKLDDLITETDSIRFSSNLKWFLAGAGVLIIGWLIGLAMGRRKKRWSSNIY